MDAETQRALCKVCLWTALESTDGQCAFHRCVFYTTGQIQHIGGFAFEVYIDRISGSKVLIDTELRKREVKHI